MSAGDALEFTACTHVRCYTVRSASGVTMFRFIGGMLEGVLIGLYLGSFPVISAELVEIGKIFSLSALSTML